MESKSNLREALAFNGNNTLNPLRLPVKLIQVLNNPEDN